MLRKWMMFLSLCLLFGTQGANAEQVVRRFVLAAGANFGGAERTPLRYAVSDAKHFAQVLETMGGVAEADQFLLREPSLDDFKGALATLRNRVSEVSQNSGRTEVVLYYSGHADESGLLLGRTRFAYQDLRQAMRDIDSDVQIAVLDACASGAITRFKGGKRQQPFMVDASSDMKGHAFLTSSSENEVAQESDAIGASFFTHYLVSGLRGAADVTGDGKVTLNEAYQFAFQNTLDRTVDTQGGAQHPAYDINMTGTGDVVMTDLRQTSAGLVLGDSLSGRFYIRDGDRKLVAELNKPMGREVEIGLPPGTYYVHLEQRQAYTTSALEIADQQRQVLKSSDFQRANQLQTVSRGGETEGLTFEMNEPQFSMEISDKRKVSLGFFYNLENEPFRGTQLSLLTNIANHRSGHQVSSLFNLGNKAVRGIQISGLSNVANGTVKVGQIAGLANVAQDSVHKVQIAGLANTAEAATNFQGAGLANITQKGKVRVQMAGLANVSGGSVLGGQFAGGVNMVRDRVKVQLAGLANISGRSVLGGQFAGGLNVVRDSVKVQVAAANVAGRIGAGQFGAFNIAHRGRGAQVGVVNIINHMKGVQIGVVNLSKRLESESIGLVSYAHNGLLNLSVSQDEVGLSHITLKSGSQHLYTAYSAGAKAFDGHSVFAIGVGFGGQIESERFYADVNGHQYLVFEDLDTPRPRNHLSRLRGSFGIKFTNHISWFAGVSANFLWHGKHRPLLSPWGGHKHVSDHGKYSTWPGYFVGLKIGRPSS